MAFEQERSGRARRDDRDTEQQLRQRAKSAPASPQAHADLCAFLCRAGRSGEALALLDDVGASRPGNLWTLSLKAAILDAERRTDEALAIHETLITHAPRAAVPWLNYGHCLKSVGRVADAVAAYRASLKADPGNGFAWWGLADLRTVPLIEEDVRLMESALGRGGGDLNRIQLHFALGKALGDVGRFEHSIRHYEQGNRLRGGLVPYDAGSLTRLVARVETAFTADMSEGPGGTGRRASGAVFVVGMPRSGSTLVEQILATHPMVEGLGELAELAELIARIGDVEDAEPSWPDIIAGLPADAAEELGRHYLASTRRYRRTDRPLFTDKMPANWRFIGPIMRILPGAKIIDVRRDPRACCLSAYTTYFNRQTRVPTTLADWGRHYREYVRAIDHFEQVRPGAIHRVRYERLVDDLDGEVRRLLAFLDLPFDPACLRFHENRRAIHTPSAQQVRRPINRDGLVRWRHYEPWLGPLTDEIAELAAPDS